MKKIKQFVQKVFFTTGVSLSLLACFAAIAGGSCIFVRTVWECLFANFCIHLFLLLTARIKSRFLLLDALIDFVVINGVILLSGYLFGWFTSTPPWVLVIMAALIYLISSLCRMLRVREEAEVINERLKRRRESVKSVKIYSKSLKDEN